MDVFTAKLFMFQALTAENAREGKCAPYTQTDTQINMSIHTYYYYLLLLPLFPYYVNV